MYEKHFSLKSRPFRSGQDSTGIFVGPAQVKIMANLKKALASPDAVACVVGDVGVGKTTVVNRALDAITSKRAVARVGRMHLAADEVLELLLTEFNVSRQPNGTIQRFAAFKRLLHDWAAAGTRAFIIVEDAERIGSDALIELEALTAADNGDGAGASIILMGQPSLADQLSQPALARLRQRIRLRQTVMPFSAMEVQGYLKHCLRAAGGEFDSIFDPGSTDMLYRCSDGVPRVLNNLCEAVLAAAAEAGATMVMPQLVQHVASEEFGLQPTRPVARDAGSYNVGRPVARDAGSYNVGRPVARNAGSCNIRDSHRSPAGARTARDAFPQPPQPPAPANAGPEIAAPGLTLEDAPAGMAPPVPEPVVTEFEPVPIATFTAEPEVRHPALVKVEAAAVNATDAPKETPALVNAADPPEVPAATANAAEAPEATAATVEAESQDTPLDDIPELIQDTQPELAALPAHDDLPDLTDLVIPGKANGAARKAPAASTKRSLPALDDIPTLSGDFKIDKRESAAAKAAPKPAPAAAKDDAKSDTTITEIPAWDRDPTLAQLKPDLAALEAALAVVPDNAPPILASSKPNAVTPPAAAAVSSAKTTAAPLSFDLPEIILEKELKVKEIEAQEQMRKAGPPDTHEVDTDAPVRRKHGFDLDRLAEELGKARSLEDVGDKLAETLFGEEMASAAAAVAARVAADQAAQQPPPAEPEKTENREDFKAAVQKPPQVPGPAVPAKAAPAKPAQASPATPPHTSQASTIAAPPVTGPAIEITLGSHPDPVPAVSAPTPEPIEEQFGTSMTATLKALSAAQVKSMDESANDEDEEKAPRRLFGLFRGST